MDGCVCAQICLIRTPEIGHWSLAFVGVIGTEVTLSN